MVEPHPLTAFRESEKISKAELARRLGVTRTAVCRWEAGERHPDKKLWPVIRKVTGLKPSEVSGFESLEAA